MIQVLRVEGWKSRRVGSVTFYKCPLCGDYYDLLTPNPKGLAQCFACNKSSAETTFVRIKKKTVIARCAHCGTEVPFVPSAVGLIGPMCSDFACSNYVAVCYGKAFLEPRTVLDTRWNPGLQSRGERISAGLLFAPCRSKKDQTILRLLQVLAKQDDERFKFGDPNEFRSALCFDRRQRRYLGFLVWTESKTAVLHQLFVVRDERRKGIASKMVNFWIDNYAKRLGERFGIEGPNEAALKLHVKLGHIKIRGSDAIGVNCHFVPTF
jgi:GNAT superfamily N-acetyltransferase